MSLLAGLWFFWMTLSWAGLVEAVLSLGDGKRWARELRDARNRVSQGSQPPLTLILPCAGQDPGLEQNLTAYCNLDYPDYQLVATPQSDVKIAYRKIRKTDLAMAKRFFRTLAQVRAYLRGRRFRGRSKFPHRYR